MLVSAKESKKTSACARDGCKNTVYQGKPYIWDTDNKKAYCSKECAEQATGHKVVENSGPKSGSPGYSKTINQQLWRNPEEAGQAIQLWHTAVIPMILQTTNESLKVMVSCDGDKAPNVKFDEKRYDIILQFWTKTYKEIFLGKMEAPVTK